jgi:hypothetical protein
MEASAKIAAFWGIVTCSLIEVNQQFRCVCCLHHQGPMMEAVLSETIRHCIPESFNIHIITLSDEHRLRVSENSVLWGIFERKRDGSDGRII